MAETEWSDGSDAPASLPAGPARPWPRLWAKLVDVSLWNWPLGFLVGHLFPEFAFQPAFQGAGGSALFGAMLLPFSLTADAMVLAAFGNTPGRALVGIRVQTIRREPLDVMTALNRNAFIYVFGMAMGLPLIALATYYNNFSKLSRGKQTSWDAQLYTRVHNDGNNTLRTALAAMLFLGMSIADRTLAMLEDQGTGANPDLTATDNQSNVATSSDPLEVKLQKEAAGVKAKMVDEITKLEGAEASGRTFNYKYKILRNDASPETLKTFFISNIIPQICSENDIVELMKNDNVVYRYTYSMPNQDNPLIIDVSWESCN